MFDIGFWELVTIAIIGIVVVGPERLPEVVRTIAAYVRKARRAFQDVKSDIERELDLDDLRRQMRDVDMEDHIKKLNQSVMDMGRDVHNSASRFDEELRYNLDINDPEVRAAHEDNDYQRYDDPDRYADTGTEPNHWLQAADGSTGKPSSTPQDTRNHSGNNQKVNPSRTDVPDNDAERSTQLPSSASDTTVTNPSSPRQHD